MDIDVLRPFEKATCQLAHGTKMRSSLLADIRYYRRVVAHYRHSMACDYLLKRLQSEPDCLHLEKIDVQPLLLLRPLPGRPFGRAGERPNPHKRRP